MDAKTARELLKQMKEAQDALVAMVERKPHRRALFGADIVANEEKIRELEQAVRYLERVERERR